MTMSRGGRVMLIGVALLAGLVVVFAFQNLDRVTVRFLAWDVQTGVALVAFVPFLAGLLTGMVAQAVRDRRRPKTRSSPTGGTQPPPASPAK